MKKKIIASNNDDYPAHDKQIVSAYDYILDKKYSTKNYELTNTLLDGKYLSVDYYVNLMALARGHIQPEIKVYKPKQYYDNRLAILVDPNELNPPSGNDSLLKMKEISDSLGFKTDILTYNQLKDSYSLYDALFIRETTFVNHHTYKIAEKCEQSGMIVMDDTLSIIKCTNKIYQNELFKLNKIPTLKSQIICKQNLLKTYMALEYPCVLKIPDSCCSLGVFKINNKTEFFNKSMQLLNDYNFLLVQEFYKTEFDWRIGVLNGKPLFACKYHMSRNGWQIIDHSDPNDDRISKCGLTDTLSLCDVPEYILDTAVNASNLIGNGLYGVDIKEKGKSCVVIEINDCIDVDIDYESIEIDSKVIFDIFETFKKRLDIIKATV